MSRIHDALKKAAQERAANQPADVALTTLHSVMNPAPNGENGAALAAADVLAETVIKPGARTDYLRFEDLRTRCTHPRWRPAPNSNIFISPEPNAHAMEQFRTLRSRLYQLRGN